jgi:hypothetical protein
MASVGKTDLMTVLAEVKRNYDEDMTTLGPDDGNPLVRALFLLVAAHDTEDPATRNTNVLGATVSLVSHMALNGTGAPIPATIVKDVINQTGAQLN